MTEDVKTIVVTAAVIEHDGRFLVTKRQRGVHLEGQWEFPGGKCDVGESLAMCLARELKEELNVAATVGREILSTTHLPGPRRRTALPAMQHHRDAGASTGTKCGG